MREPEKAGRNRGGLLQRDSSTLWQNATGSMDQNRTERLIAWTGRRSPGSQRRSGGLRLNRKQVQMLVARLPKLL